MYKFTLYSSVLWYLFISFVLCFFWVTCFLTAGFCWKQTIHIWNRISDIGIKKIISSLWRLRMFSVLCCKKIRIKHMIQFEKKRRHQKVGRKPESRNTTTCTCLDNIVKVLTVSKGIVVNFDTQSNRLNSSIQITGDSFIFSSFFKCSFWRKKDGQEGLHRYSNGLSQ